MSQNPTDIDGLVQLLNYRWSVLVVAELASARGSKLVTLCQRLGVGRESLKRSLSVLIEQGIVRKNPGYGHPMRPEYILTQAGQIIGTASERLANVVRELNLEALAFQKWSLPVLYVVSTGATRFRGIQTALPSVTSRALALSLKILEQAQLLKRGVKDGYPPTSTYTLTQRSSEIVTRVAELNTSINECAKALP